jgi:hypothetical protein
MGAFTGSERPTIRESLDQQQTVFPLFVAPDDSCLVGYACVRTGSQDICVVHLTGSSATTLGRADGKPGNQSTAIASVTGNQYNPPL